MTREEAIIYIKNLREYMKMISEESEYGFIEENYIALDMGIKNLEQEPILDKIRAEIEELYSYVEFDEDTKTSFNMVRLEEVQRVIDKYKAESEK